MLMNLSVPRIPRGNLDLAFRLALKIRHNDLTEFDSVTYADQRSWAIGGIMYLSLGKVCIQSVMQLKSYPERVKIFTLRTGIALPEIVKVQNLLASHVE